MTLDHLVVGIHAIITINDLFKLQNQIAIEFHHQISF